MLVRLALETDVDAIIEMARENNEATCAHEYHLFSPDHVRATFQRYLDSAESTFFVCEGPGRKVIGFVQAAVYGYDYRSGLFVTQRVLYVSPEHRGTRAAVLLMKALIEWAKHMGADRIDGGNDNGFRSERTAKFLEHFGFKTTGYAMRLKLDGADGQQ